MAQIRQEKNVNNDNVGLVSFRDEKFDSEFWNVSS